MRKAPFSIRFVLLALLLVSTIPMAIGLGVSAYLNSVETVQLMWRDLADELMEDAQEKTLRYVEPGPSALELHRLMTEDGTLRPEDREALLSALLRCIKAQPSATWCSFGGNDGSYLAAYREPDGAIRLTHRERGGEHSIQRDYQITSSGDRRLISEGVTDFDPRTRPWWEIGKNAESATWSDPFLFASRQQPGVVLTLNQPKRSNTRGGVWLMEYELSHIARFLQKMKKVAQLRGGLLAKAKVYILSKEGLVIGHPEGKTVTTKSDKAQLIPAREHEDTQLSKAYRHAAQNDLNKRQRFRYQVGSEEYLGMSAPFKIEGAPSWTALVTIPADSLLGPIRKNNRTAALIASGVAFLSILLGMLLAERFVRLLSNLAHDLDRIARLDFSPSKQKKDTWIGEIAEMIAARDRMTGALGSFSKYVPSGLVRQLMAKGQEATLGGETRELTVYFSDIVGFTSIAEKLSPSELVDALADYLGEMSHIIAEEMGTVDKYIGDAIMAFWGAPLDVERHPEAACRAALRCQSRLAEMRESWRGTDAPEIYARIGVNTGECLVGNIGAETRMNYTVMGDPVNVASRLEAQCKSYHVEVLIGERTLELAGDSIVARPVDKIAVKGKEQGIVVYELLAMANSATQQEKELARLSKQAFESYVSGDFSEAAVLFELLLAEYPEDISLSRLLTRCESYQQVPPQDWNGVTVLTAK